MEEWGNLREKRDVILENKAKVMGKKKSDLFRRKIKERKSRPKIVMVNSMGQEPTHVFRAHGTIAL